MTIERVREVRPDLTDSEAAEVIALMINDGAPMNEEAMCVFADWLYDVNSRRLLRQQQEASGKFSNNL